MDRGIVGEKLNKETGAGTDGYLLRALKAGNALIMRIDRIPLWWIGLLFLGVTFLPYVILGEGSVFEIHDQLDETLMTYVLNARHFGDGENYFPELLGGINASGMQPSAILFIPLYRIFSAFTAFVLQYFIVCAVGFFGMYACVKELTGSSILAVIAAGCFALLPAQPVYGLSVWGVPLLFYVFLCLWQRKYPIRCFAALLLFGLTTHLVLIGYVVLSFWALAILWQLVKKKRNGWVIAGFFSLMGIYIGVNHNLFLELLLGQSNYVSHREELVNTGFPFWKTVVDVFLNSSQHAVSLHKYLILPIIILLILGGVRYRKLEEVGRRSYLAAMGIFIVLLGIAVLFGICRSQWIADWKNGQTGFFRYFQLERYYWLYPALWYLDFVLAFHVWWSKTERRQPQLMKLVVLMAALLPTLNQIKLNSYFYMNINQYNNGSGITGYISWESYYAEELMEEVELAIGRKMSDYRVAHLGISPAPSLMHGFYTVDGYSNNYPLEYKQQFRKVIEKELEKSEATRLYFDQWGSRCYLFNVSSGTYWNMGKEEEVKYEHLDFNMDALKELGCEYLLSGGELLCAEELGLAFMGYYETENSYWGIWLYQLTDVR